MNNKQVQGKKKEFKRFLKIYLETIYIFKL